METYGYSIRRLEKTVDAETFVRNYVDIPKIAGYCAECSEYGKNWACPAYKFHAEDLWKRYKTVRLIGEKLTLSDRLKDKKYTDVGVEDFLNEMFTREKIKMTLFIRHLENKYRGSRILSSLICSYCKRCARLDGKPCRHPDKMRFMIEGVGGDVEAMSKDLFGIEILWTKDGVLPPYYVIFFALLMKD